MDIDDEPTRGTVLCQVQRHMYRHCGQTLYFMVITNVEMFLRIGCGRSSLGVIQRGIIKARRSSQLCSLLSTLLRFREGPLLGSDSMTPGPLARSFAAEVFSSVSYKSSMVLQIVSTR